MYLVIFENVQQLRCITCVSTALCRCIGSRCMQVEEHETAFGHIAQILFQPCQLGRSKSFFVFLSALVVYVFHGYDMYLADVERVIGRTECFVVIGFSITRFRNFRAFHIGILKVEIVIPDDLEHCQPQVGNTFFVWFHQVHGIPNQISHGHAYHFFSFERIHCAFQVGNGFLPETVEMSVGFHLRVGNGNVYKPAGRGFPWFEHEITDVFL